MPTSVPSMPAARMVAQVESAFGDAGELVQQARELLVAAGNASYGPAERRGIAQQLAAIRTQLLQVANRGDGAGGFLFSGQGVGCAAVRRCARRRDIWRDRRHHAHGVERAVAAGRRRRARRSSRRAAATACS